MKLPKLHIRDLFWLVLVAALPCGEAGAQTTHQMANGTKRAKPWSEVVGQRVVVEGLAWGATEKGLGARVILENGAVYLSRVDLLEQKAQGKLVRVTGVLRSKRLPAAKGGGEGPAADVLYYSIETERLEILDEVKWPWMQEVLSK